MIDKEKYMSDVENSILENDISKQVQTLKMNLSDKSNFVKKDINKKISIMRVGDDTNANE